MPAWINDLLANGNLAAVAFTLFILYLLGHAIYKLFPIISKFVKLINLLVGDDENPGIGVRMDKQTEKLEAVRHQVQNDHRTNLRDDFDALTADVKELNDSLKTHIAISKARENEESENAYRVAVLTDKVNKMYPVLEELGKTWGPKPHINIRREE